MAGDNASEMPHKFKIGDIINYRPNTRVRRVPSGKSLITGLLPQKDGSLIALAFE